METMKLQGAIFDFPGTLLDSEGQPLPGLDRFLSLMKMEDVWMYLVTDADRPGAQKRLEDNQLSSYFRGVTTAEEHSCSPTDPELYEKTVKRLRTARQATVIFTARPEVLRAMKEADFQVVLVGQHPAELAALADMTIPDYRDMSQFDQH